MGIFFNKIDSPQPTAALTQELIDNTIFGGIYDSNPAGLPVCLMMIKREIDETTNRAISQIVLWGNAISEDYDYSPTMKQRFINSFQTAGFKIIAADNQNELCFSIEEDRFIEALIKFRIPSYDRRDGKSETPTTQAYFRNMPDIITWYTNTL